MAAAAMKRECFYGATLCCYKCMVGATTTSLEIQMRRRNILQLSFVEDNNKSVVMNVDDVVSPVFSTCTLIPLSILASPAPSRGQFVADFLRSACGLQEESICENLANQIVWFVGKQTQNLGLGGFDIVAHVDVVAIDVNDTIHPQQQHGFVTNTATTSTTSTSTSSSML